MVAAVVARKVALPVPRPEGLEVLRPKSPQGLADLGHRGLGGFLRGRGPRRVVGDEEEVRVLRVEDEAVVGRLEAAVDREARRVLRRRPREGAPRPVDDARQRIFREERIRGRPAQAAVRSTPLVVAAVLGPRPRARRVRGAFRAVRDLEVRAREDVRFVGEIGRGAGFVEARLGPDVRDVLEGVGERVHVDLGPAEARPRGAVEEALRRVHRRARPVRRLWGDDVPRAPEPLVAVARERRALYGSCRRGREGERESGLYPHDGVVWCRRTFAGHALESCALESSVPSAAHDSTERATLVAARVHGPRLVSTRPDSRRDSRRDSRLSRASAAKRGAAGRRDSDVRASAARRGTAGRRDPRRRGDPGRGAAVAARGRVGQSPRVGRRGRRAGGRDRAGQSPCVGRRGR
mmetsp:Transcript_19269/g.60296  ORF Transcript_19269/g.60296 Transcript_19269/m.60296 type:complete len:407 (-) Transcript_19269:669-1889(-)